MLPGPLLDIWDMGTFFGAHFLKKRAFGFLAPSKQISFLTISTDFQNLEHQIACDSHTQQRPRIVLGFKKYFEFCKKYSREKVNKENVNKEK